MSGATNNLAKLARVVNAMEPRFGAVGNGVANDTAALIAASVAAGVGGTVILPQGVSFGIAGEFAMNIAGQRFVGYGASLAELGSFSGSVLIRVAATDVRIEGLRIIGSSNSFSGIGCTAEVADGIQAVNNEVSGCAYGITANTQSDVLFEGNYIHDCTNPPIRCQNTSGARQNQNIRILNNTLDTSHLNPATATAMCCLVRGDASAYTRGVVVSGNRFVMPVDPTDSAVMGCEMRYVTEATFSENNALNGAMLVSVAISKTVAVDGNTSKGATFYAVEIATTCSNITVSDNTIDGLGVLNYGIGLQGSAACTGATVTGNTIINTNLYGILGNEQWTDVVISDNIISSGTAGFVRGINLSAMGDGTVISNNRLNGQGVGNKAITINDMSDVTITGNVTTGWLENDVYLQATNLTIEGIAITGNRFGSGRAGNSIITALSGSGALGIEIQAYCNPGYRIAGTTTTDIHDLANAVYSCTGSATPVSNVAAGIGSSYQRRGGGAGTSFYIKEGATDADWAPK